jgi:hypothetical protein
MAHCGKNGFARKLRRGNMLFHAILFDQAERRLDRVKRLVQRLPVSRLVPQSSQRISKIDVGLGGVEAEAASCSLALLFSRSAVATSALPRLAFVVAQL